MRQILTTYLLYKNSSRTCMLIKLQGNVLMASTEIEAASIPAAIASMRDMPADGRWKETAHAAILEGMERDEPCIVV